MAPQASMDMAFSMGPPGELDMEVEVDRHDVGGELYDTVRKAGETGITVVQLAKALDLDRRTIEARVRGADVGVYDWEPSAKGRGNSMRVWIHEVR